MIESGERNTIESKHSPLNKSAIIDILIYIAYCNLEHEMYCAKGANESVHAQLFQLKDELIRRPNLDSLEQVLQHPVFEHFQMYLYFIREKYVYVRTTDWLSKEILAHLNETGEEGCSETIISAQNLIAPLKWDRFSLRRFHEYCHTLDELV